MAEKDSDNKSDKSEEPKKSAKSKKSESFTTHGGRVIDSKIVVGKKTRLTPHEQGQLARGEIDENLEPTGKEPDNKPGDVRTVKTDRTLYRGDLTCHAVAAATGEKVSVRLNVAEPCTKEGVFYHFQQYHPSAERDSFEIDPSNESDPTLRTSLEK